MTPLKVSDCSCAPDNVMMTVPERVQPLGAERWGIRMLQQPTRQIPAPFPPDLNLNSYHTFPLYCAAVIPYREMNPDHHSGLCDCTNVSNDHQRRLVVAFDGTQNEFGTQVRENLMMPPLRMWIITLQHQSSHVVEFYSRIAKTSDQLSYYTSGIGTFVPTSSRARRPHMWIKNKWASMLGR